MQPATTAIGQRQSVNARIIKVRVIADKQFSSLTMIKLYYDWYDVKRVPNKEKQLVTICHELLAV